MSRLFVDDNFIQTVVQRFSDMILRIAYSNVHNMKDAEDITQETLISLIKWEKPFKNYEHVKAWLIRATINRCKDLKKSAWVKRRGAMPKEIAQITSEKEEIMEEIGALSLNYRNVIYLYYYEEYTIPEIAHILDKSVNTISSQLQRARKRLKNILEEGD